jgi:hypothetical protein
MAFLPLATCTRLLGIHPKTLHRWLGEAHIPLAPHPSDARLKCLAEEHLLEVARWHGRPLPDFASAPASPEEQARFLSAKEAQPAPPAALLSPPAASLADLIQHLAGLETKIVTLQEQLAQLALAVLQERERTVESRITALEALVQPLVGRHVLPDLPGPEAEQESSCASPRQHRLLPAEQRARSRMPALIEYGAQGTYVIITSRGAASCPWCPIRRSGLSGWRPSPRSASSVGRDASPPIATPSVGAQRAPGERIAPSTSTTTSARWASPMP